MLAAEKATKMSLRSLLYKTDLDPGFLHGPKDIDQSWGPPAAKHVKLISSAHSLIYGILCNAGESRPKPQEPRRVLECKYDWIEVTKQYAKKALSCRIADKVYSPVSKVTDVAPLLCIRRHCRF